MLKVRAVLLTLLIAWQIVTSAQSPSAVPFEVASVKPNHSDGEPSMIVPSRGTVVITNVPLLNVIVNAYGIPAFRMVGAPAWITRERFDISARIPDTSSPGQVRSMLQTLLVQRFNLKAHQETREQPVYEVVVARPDGRLGPRLKRSDSDCATANNPPAVPPSLDSPCAGLFGVGPGGGRIVSKGQPLDRVISALSMAVSRAVVDRTALQGPFDVDLQWGADVGTAVTISDTPSIFTALQEQLGLRLQPSRGLVDVLVIDNVERPTPD
jgi:uncharacterized protein (TIGR03435 family)